jgi:hypothetical protein
MQAILGKTMKKRYSIKVITVNQISNRAQEKFINSAGITIRMGIARAARYKLLGQIAPRARSANLTMSPSLAIFLENTFKPDIQSAPSRR